MTKLTPRRKQIRKKEVQNNKWLNWPLRDFFFIQLSVALIWPSRLTGRWTNYLSIYLSIYDHWCHLVTMISRRHYDDLTSGGSMSWCHCDVVTSLWRHRLRAMRRVMPRGCFWIVMTVVIHGPRLKDHQQVEFKIVAYCWRRLLGITPGETAVKPD